MIFYYLPSFLIGFEAISLDSGSLCAFLRVDAWMYTYDAGMPPPPVLYNHTPII